MLRVMPGVEVAGWHAAGGQCRPIFDCVQVDPVESDRAVVIVPRVPTVPSVSTVPFVPLSRGCPTGTALRTVPRDSALRFRAPPMAF